MVNAQNLVKSSHRLSTLAKICLHGGLGIYLQVSFEGQLRWQENILECSMFSWTKIPEPDGFNGL